VGVRGGSGRFAEALGPGAREAGGVVEAVEEGADGAGQFRVVCVAEDLVIARKVRRAQPRERQQGLDDELFGVAGVTAARALTEAHVGAFPSTDQGNVEGGRESEVHEAHQVSGKRPEEALLELVDFHAERAARFVSERASVRQPMEQLAAAGQVGEFLDARIPGVGSGPQGAEVGTPQLERLPEAPQRTCNPGRPTSPAASSASRPKSSSGAEATYR